MRTLLPTLCLVVLWGRVVQAEHKRADMDAEGAARIVERELKKYEAAFKCPAEAVHVGRHGESQYCFLPDAEGNRLKEGPSIEMKISSLASLGTWSKGKKQGVWLESDDFGIRKGRYEDDVLEGEWITTFNGVPLWAKTYAHGVLQGPWRSYHDGKVSVKANFEGGKLQGPWQLFYPNAKMASQGIYESGKREGVWTTYYPSGKVSRVLNYCDNKPCKTSEDFYESGQKHHYIRLSGVDDLYGPFGQQQIWDPRGIMLEDCQAFVKPDWSTFEAGGRCRKYFPDGKVMSEGTVT